MVKEHGMVQFSLGINRKLVTNMPRQWKYIFVEEKKKVKVCFLLIPRASTTQDVWKSNDIFK